MVCGGPDEGWVISSVGIGAAIVPIGSAPGVDEVWVGISRAADHRRFGFEVAFGRWREIVLVGTEEIDEENYASVGVIPGVEARGWIGHGVCCGGIRIVIGKIAIAGGLEGGDFGFGSGVGTVTANGSRSTESEACEDADDGDDGEKLD